MTPIEAIHISKQGAFSQARLLGTSDEPLGFVVEMMKLSQALKQALSPDAHVISGKWVDYDVAQKKVTIMTPQGSQCIRARWVVAADGTHSSVRQSAGLSAQVKDYQQQAIVANIGLNRSHGFWAYERFTSTGPLAMLPMTENRSSLVWSLTPIKAQELMELDDAAFLKALQRAFGYRLGRLTKVGRRAVYPLQQVVMREQVVGSIVFIGNAAHTIHPVAGQGFNLGLRDVAMLAQCCAEQGLNDNALQVYQQLRRDDHKLITQATDRLISLFGCDWPGVAGLRQCGLSILDNSDFLKQAVVHYGSGLGGPLPDLVCGIPLQLKQAL